MIITPDFLISFETALKGLVTGNWDRVHNNLMWDKVMKPYPVEGKVEIFTWLLESAIIRPEGNGGNKRFDDLAAATTQLEVFNFGSGLRLTKNEIEDNQLKDNPSVGALDYARKWASDIGSSSAYFPQSQLFALIAAGTSTGIAYDGLSFFNTAHPLNPLGGAAVYSNITTGVPLVVSGGSTEQDNLIVSRRNLGKALAGIRQQRFINGVPRFLKPKALYVPTTLADQAITLVAAQFIAQTENTIDSANQGNRLEVVVCAELDNEPSVYYIGVEDTLSDELGAFMFADREKFSMTTYGPMDDAVLQRQKMFEWSMDGRAGTMYGHPYLFYRCTP